MLLVDSALTKQLAPRLDTLPFIRWPGGKRWLMPKLQRILTNVRFKRFFEPFLGGGAFYFFFSTSPAILSDLNPELVNTYLHVRDHPNQLLDELRRLHVKESNYTSF